MTWTVPLIPHCLPPPGTCAVCSLRRRQGECERRLHASHHGVGQCHVLNERAQIPVTHKWLCLSDVRGVAVGALQHSPTSLTSRNYGSTGGFRLPALLVSDGEESEESLFRFNKNSLPHLPVSTSSYWSSKVGALEMDRPTSQGEVIQLVLLLLALHTRFPSPAHACRSATERRPELGLSL